MRLIFFTEEPSAEAFINGYLPRVIPDDVHIDVKVFQSKQSLLKSLPKRLSAYAKDILPNMERAGEKAKLIILTDKHGQDCKKLKRELEQKAASSSLVTKTVNHTSFAVVNRIVCHELESWYLGDLAAVEKAYPGVPRRQQNKTKFRDPDRLANAKVEFEKLIQKAGRHGGGLEKIQAAREMAPMMDTNVKNNKSKSFVNFIKGVVAAINDP